MMSNHKSNDNAKDGDDDDNDDDDGDFNDDVQWKGSNKSQWYFWLNDL